MSDERLDISYVARAEQYLNWVPLVMIVIVAIATIDGVPSFVGFVVYCTLAKAGLRPPIISEFEFMPSVSQTAARVP